ncbi:MAG: helix-turn-helix domain-containing protein [Burkholderiaceae bacterium]|nr:helix-turn-helix domain-containing protein [Burkholderiaceae bacterium]
MGGDTSRTTARARRGAATAGARRRLSVPALAQQVRAWADSALGIAGAALELKLTTAAAQARTPAQQELLRQAGRWLQRARRAAGYTLAELGRAIDLRDPALLALVENGRAALPFEVILRLSAVLGRNDPIEFAVNLTRTARPELWQALERLGIGRLLLQSARERAFANVYRAHEATRRLSDAEFAALLRLVDAAVRLALAFRAQEPGGSPRPRARKRRDVRT